MENPKYCLCQISYLFKLRLPVISKDKIKELLFDAVGFQSRTEKEKLGFTSMEIMYYAQKHVVNDCYLEKKGRDLEERKVASISYENYVNGLEESLTLFRLAPG